jgi:O-methyltransferase domain/Dimerisation domain
MKTASEEVADMIFLNKWSSQTLCAAAELGVFDLLSSVNGRTASDVAADLRVDPKLLYRLLRAIASLGLLNEAEGGKFTLTEQGAVFSKAMSGFSAIQCAWALEALRDYDFSSISTWCDVGGGHGHMMYSFLDVYSGLSGTVLDLPEVIAETRPLWATKLGLEERCRYLSGDMFKRVPVKADVYSLKMILHDWNDTEYAQILQNIRRAAKPGGRVFIIEHIVAGPNQPHFSKLFDTT